LLLTVGAVLSKDTRAGTPSPAAAARDTNTRQERGTHVPRREWAPRGEAAEIRGRATSPEPDSW